MDPELNTQPAAPGGEPPPPAPAGLNTDQLSMYAELDEEKKELNQRLKTINATMTSLEPSIITDLVTFRLTKVETEAMTPAAKLAGQLRQWALECFEAGRDGKPMPDPPAIPVLHGPRKPFKRSLKIAQDVFASPLDKDKDSVIEALKSLEDLRDYVTESFNSQSLQGYVREIARDVQTACTETGKAYDAEAIKAALPEVLAEKLKISIVPVLRCTKT
jgi:hypothetical protein